MKKTLLFLHHTGVDSPNPQFLSVNDYHKRKKFPKSKLGLFGGYMYIIENDGLVMQYRGEDELGAHTYVKGKTYNEDGIGVCLAGNGTFTQAQKDALVALCRGICERHGILQENILNHWDVKKTGCPGQDLAGYVRNALQSPFAPLGSISLPERIKRIQKALQRATGARLKSLQRALARLIG